MRKKSEEHRGSLIGMKFSAGETQARCPCQKSTRFSEIDNGRLLSKTAYLIPA